MVEFDQQWASSLKIRFRNNNKPVNGYICSSLWLALKVYFNLIQNGWSLKIVFLLLSIDLNATKMMHLKDS